MSHWPDKRVMFDGAPVFFMRELEGGWCLLRKTMRVPSEWGGLTPVRIEIKAPLVLVAEARA